MSIDGILNVFKPPGKTSFEIVSLVRRLSGERRVGHSGTLDPMATGVLLLCLGQGTRVVEFMITSNKIYRTRLELGLATDTYDATGRVIRRHGSFFTTLSQIEEVLDTLRGTIEQIPPMYSALKYRGRPLYQLARQGIEVTRLARKVHISRLEIMEWQSPFLTLEIECSSGTYIRSLAHDIGVSLGCGACVKDLIRLRCGTFDVRQSVPLLLLEEAFHCGYWQDFIYPIDEVLLNWDAAIVGEETERSIRNGRSMDATNCSVCRDRDEALPTGSKYCRAYSAEGKLVAILQWQPEEELWHPEKVFSL